MEGTVFILGNDDESISRFLLSYIIENGAVPRYGYISDSIKFELEYQQKHAWNVAEFILFKHCLQEIEGLCKIVKSYYGSRILRDATTMTDEIASKIRNTYALPVHKRYWITDYLKMAAKHTESIYKGLLVTSRHYLLTPTIVLANKSCFIASAFFAFTDTVIVLPHAQGHNINKLVSYIGANKGDFLEMFRNLEDNQFILVSIHDHHFMLCET